MFLNFICPACDNEIQAEYQHIGSWVACPLCSFEQVVPDPPLAIGASHNGYIIESIGDSNMLWLGYVAKGEQDSSDAKVLLRVPTSFFLKNVSDFDAFVSAASAGGMLNIDGLARLLDKSLTHGKVFFVYDLLQKGKPLSSLSSSSSPFRIADVVIFAKRFAEVMAKAWEQNHEAHLNLTPESIMTNSRFDIQVLDYGLSRPLLNDPQLSSTGFNIWDQRYMAPELRSGKYDFGSSAADIYSFGALLFFLLTGKHPFEETEFDQNTSFPELPSSLALPESLSSLISRATAFYPQTRFRSWHDIIESLNTICEALGLSSSVDEIEKRTTRRFSMDELPRAKRTVGLTHTNIKIDKKLKFTAPKKKLRMSETIAKLSSIPRSALDSFKGQTNPSSQKASGDRLFVFGVIAALVVLAMMVPLAIYFLSPSSPVPESSSPPPEAAIAPVAAKTDLPQKKEHVATAPDSGPKAKYHAMLKAAAEFEAANPDSFAQLLKKYDEAADYAFKVKDFSLMDQARDKVNKTIERRDARISEIMKKLEKEAEPLIAAGDSEGACKIYLEYAGLLAEDFADKRKLAAEKIRQMSTRDTVDKKFNELQSEAEKLFAYGNCSQAVELLESYQGELANETVAARKKLAASLKKQGGPVLEAAAPVIKTVVPLLCHIETGKLLSLLQEASKSDSAAPARKQLESLIGDIEKFKALDELFLADMQANLKKTVNFTLTGHKEASYTVLEIKTGSVLLKEGEQQTQVWFKDLSLESKLAFASKQSNLAEHPVLCLLIGLQSNDQSYLAKDIFANLPLKLDVLVPAELKEMAAKEDFEKMLDSCGLPYDKIDYNSFISQMLKKDFTAGIASKIMSSLEEFKEKYSSTKFAEKHKGTIENIERNCRRAGAIISQKVVVDPDFLKKNNLSFPDILEKAQSSTTIEIKKGSYHLGNTTLCITKTGIKIIGEEGVEFLDGSLKVMADRVRVSNIIFRKGRLELASSNDLHLENCYFYGTGSSLKNSGRTLMENCFFKGLHVLACKNIELNHCTLVGNTAIDDKVSCALLFAGDEFSASNCVFYGDVYAVAVTSKADKRKFSIATSLLYGETGICAELQDSGGISKNVAKNESGFRRYSKSFKNIIAPIQFISPGDSNYALIKDTPGFAAASDGKDCGVLWRIPPVPIPDKDAKK
ncbi:MAG: hypothetical protein A2X49_08215 [Lentisphaerae bacterium GWF2_52_8]|nr:MAG: hypothetical protein A2X49_08215 [Lentisphaerae bacterium GWF2_52_8]